MNMLRKLLLGIVLSLFFTSSFAAAHSPKFFVLPNINTQQLMLKNAASTMAVETKAINLVKQTLNINETSPYKAVRLSLQYNKAQTVDSIIVYLLSAKYKSFELVKIILNADFTVAFVIKNYHLTKADFMQTPAYAHKHQPYCPDASVQFVIGNNFGGDESVEAEVQKTYQLAKEHGYNPILLDVNYPNRPQPTIESYENWMSCPNVKGFYNESHGWEEGILLSDGDFSYSLIESDLVNQLNNKVTLFDSCETFHNPLLDSVMNVKKGNAQQYIAGIISLPFGPSERTATCFWTIAFDHGALNRKKLNACSKKNHLKLDGYGIGGNYDNHLTPAS
jgi:hypothetical protein